MKGNNIGFGYEEQPDGFDWWKLLAILALGMMILGIFTRCKTKYVSVPEYHKEYIVRSDTVAKVDSVYMKDSVFVYHNGDTIIINKVLYRDRYKNVYKVRVDTIMRSDSVRVPYPVEKELTKVEKRYMTVGKYVMKAFQWILVAAILAFLSWLAGKIMKK